MSEEISTVVGIPDISFTQCTQSAGCSLSTVTPATLSKLTVDSIPVHENVYCLASGNAINPSAPPPTLPCTCDATIAGSSTKLKVDSKALNRKGDQVSPMGNITGPGSGGTVVINSTQTKLKSG